MAIYVDYHVQRTVQAVGLWSNGHLFRASDLQMLAKRKKRRGVSPAPLRRSAFRPDQCFFFFFFAVSALASSVGAVVDASGAELGVVALSDAGAGVLASGGAVGAGCAVVSGIDVVGGVVGVVWPACCAVAGRAMARAAPAMAVLKILIFIAVILSAIGPLCSRHGPRRALFRP